GVRRTIGVRHRGAARDPLHLRGRSALLPRRQPRPRRDARGPADPGRGDAGPRARRRADLASSVRDLRTGIATDPVHAEFVVAGGRRTSWRRWRQTMSPIAPILVELRLLAPLATSHVVIGPMWR